MRRFVLLTNKRWHNSLFANLQKTEGAEWTRITKKEDFTAERLALLKPEFIFIPHWSHIIPPDVYDKYNCVVFHMTDLPFGRGGSPLQNLIVRGITETKISAIKVEEGIDTGAIYLKKPLILTGTAEEIFIRAAEIIESMIYEIMRNKAEPVPQNGEPVLFKRRKAQDGDISKLTDLSQVYDFIRMLDCEGYPNAFIETDYFKIEFTRASLKGDESIIADVRITKK